MLKTLIKAITPLKIYLSRREIDKKMNNGKVRQIAINTKYYNRDDKGSENLYIAGTGTVLEDLNILLSELIENTHDELLFELK